MYKIVTATQVLEFDSLGDAEEVAEAYFKIFGVVLAIEETADSSKAGGDEVLCPSGCLCGWCEVGRWTKEDEDAEV